jgi:hypothetical protein
MTGMRAAALAGVFLLMARICAGGTSGGQPPQHRQRPPSSVTSPRVVTLVVHCDPGMDPKAPLDSIPIPAECAALNAEAPADGKPHRWLVLASLPPGHPLPLHGLSFGLGGYDPERVEIVDWGPWPFPNDYMEIPNVGWPAPNRGTSVAWSYPDTAEATTAALVPVYWFIARASTPCSIPLAPDPNQGDEFAAGPGRPVTLYRFAQYSTIGFGEAGRNSCARRTRPSWTPVDVRYALAGSRRNPTYAGAIEGTAREYFVFALVDSFPEQSWIRDADSIEVRSSVPLVRVGLTAGPARRSAPGGGSTPDEGRAPILLAYWTLQVPKDAGPGPFTLVLSPPQDSTARIMLFERADLTYRTMLSR